MRIRTRYLLALIVLALLMAGPFVGVAVFAWAEGSLEHRAIFTHYFQQLLPIGALLTVLALLVGFALLIVSFVLMSLVWQRLPNALR